MYVIEHVANSWISYENPVDWMFCAFWFQASGFLSEVENNLYIIQH